MSPDTRKNFLAALLFGLAISLITIPAFSQAATKRTICPMVSGSLSSGA